jgi:hypothetical protein
LKKNYLLFNENDLKFNEEKMEEDLVKNSYLNHFFFYSNKFDHYYNFNKFLANLKFNHSFLPDSVVLFFPA